MSSDSYFCLCCLSTNDLECFFSEQNEENYAEFLKTFCAVKVSNQNLDDSTYICSECAKQLKAMKHFKQQVQDTLNLLQMNGLIKTRKGKGGFLLVQKVKYEELFIETKSNIKSELMSEDIEIMEPDISEYPENYCQIESIELPIEESNDFEETEIGDQFLTPRYQTREKRITVSRKLKKPKPATQKQALYVIPEDLKCNLCNLTLHNIRMFHIHMNGHYPNHICDVCGRKFLSIQRLKRHKPSHNKGPFECAFCDKIFSNYNTMNSHRQRKHTNGQIYKCNFCKERFTTFNRRMLHLADVHGQKEKKYKCSLCPQEFLVSGSLSTHIRRMHDKEKRFKCNQCTSGFFNKEDLVGHKTIHSGEKLFSCKSCKKTFPRRKSLAVHEKIHKNDKKFACGHCGKRFIQKCSLKCHLKVHENKMVDMEMLDLDD